MAAREWQAKDLAPQPVGVVLGVLRLVWFVLATMLFVPLVLVARIGDSDGRRAYRLARWWAWLNVRAAGVEVEVDGLGYLDSGSSYVFMANHRSAFDVRGALGLPAAVGGEGGARPRPRIRGRPPGDEADLRRPQQSRRGAREPRGGARASGAA